MGEIREHKAREVMTFMRDNPDKPFSIEDVSAAIGWTRTSTTTALSRMMTTYPENMQRVSKGVYRWNSKQIEKPADDPTVFLFEVLTIQDNIYLCRDDAGKLYRVTEFSLKGE